MLINILNLLHRSICVSFKVCSHPVLVIPHLWGPSMHSPRRAAPTDIVSDRSRPYRTATNHQRLARALQPSRPWQQTQRRGRWIWYRGRKTSSTLNKTKEGELRPAWVKCTNICNIIRPLVSCSFASVHLVVGVALTFYSDSQILLFAFAWVMLAPPPCTIWCCTARTCLWTSLRLWVCTCRWVRSSPTNSPSPCWTAATSGSIRQDYDRRTQHRGRLELDWYWIIYIYTYHK